jgi:hypothetical protein
MLLPENVYRAGMLKYLAMNHYEEYKRVADVYAIDLTVKVDTYLAQGLATELGLNSRQQENMRSWLRKYGLHLEHQPVVMQKIDREVGLESDGPIFGEYELEIEGKDTR